MEYLNPELNQIEVFGLRKNYPNESVCGDDWFVFQNDTQTLIALIDGLGHGEKAHESARAAVTAIESICHESTTLSLIEVMAVCHSNLKRLRGAAIALVLIVGDQCQFLSIGNVQLQHSKNSSLGVLCRPGIVGRRREKSAPMSFTLESETDYFLFSDGLKGQMTHNSRATDLKHITEHAFETCYQGNDDASLLGFRKCIPDINH